MIEVSPLVVDHPGHPQREVEKPLNGVLTMTEKLNLDEMVSEIIGRLCKGLEITYKLHRNGARCLAPELHFDCDTCLLPVNMGSGKVKGELCQALKLFTKLEREYYILRILQLLTLYVQRKEGEPEWMKSKKEQINEVQMKLF